MFVGVEANAATYYVSPTGSNTAPYDTWAKAANLPHTVIALNPVGGPHTIYIAPGTYASYVNPTNSNWNSSAILGTSADGSTNPATKGQVVISALAGYHAFSTTATGLQVKYLEFTGTDSTHDTLYIVGSGFVGRSLWLKDSGRRLIYLGSTGIDLMYFLAEGSVQGIKTSATGSGTLSYGIVRSSTTNYASSNVYSGFTSSSSGNFVLNHVDVMGSIAFAIEQSGTGKTTVNNSMIFAGNVEDAAWQTAGTLIFNNCYLVPNKYTPGTLYVGTVTLNNCITTAYPSFVRRQRTGFIIPNMDDGGDVQYKLDVAAELKARGMKGTWYIQSSALTGDTLSTAQALIADGTIEIGGHSYSHSNLTLTGDVFTITKAGATINVDRTNDEIVVSPGGTVTGFKSKTIATIRTELTALGCALGDLQTGQHDTAFGEIINDSSGAQASPYSLQYLIDTTCNSGLFKAEIKDAKEAMEMALGITLYSFSTPGGASSADLSAAVLACGYTSNRVGSNAIGKNSLLQNIDLGYLYYVASLRNLADDDTVQQYARYVAESVADLGNIYPDLMHTASERTIAQWRVWLDELARYPEVTVTSMYDAVNTIKTSGTWSTADNRTYTRTWTDQSDYHLLPTSPAIDSGTDVSLTTDYAGNSIYGIPDMGGYEYQPPYTFALNKIPTTGSTRLYSDGKYRMTTASSTSATANFSVTPAEGSYYATTTQYMDITINTWETTGDKNKQWTATSTSGDFLTHATSTIYTIGDLAPDTYYQFKLDGTASTTAITGSTCNTNGSCLSDSSGNLTFTYQGGYSTHTFALDKDITAPTNVGISSITVGSSSQLTINALTAADSASGLNSTPYWINETSVNTGGSSSANWQASTSFIDTGLSPNTQYSYQIKARDANGNVSSYSAISSKYTLANTPTNLIASSIGSSHLTLSLDNLPNATSGSSGYYFSRSGANSGWIQTNSWQDTNLSCGTSYTYSVKYRNGDGVETNTISLIPSTSSCGSPSYQPTSCSSVAYDDWQTTCVNGWQYRNIKSQSPSGCVLTSSQENDRKRQCGSTATDIETTPTAPTPTATSETSVADSVGNVAWKQILNDAEIIATGDVSQLTAEMGVKRDLAAESNYSQTIIESIVKGAGSSNQTRNTITNFVTYGTQTTQLLGAGERAGVINSFKSAFGKLPTTQEDWNDAIKIANGRWPSQISKTAEDRATISFKKIYLRTPDRKNPHDDAAITVMAYGLRPANRNLKSEKTAIQTFKAIYGYSPSTTTAWDMVRAIAYSGATR